MPTAPALLIVGTDEADDDGRPLYWSSTNGWVPLPQAGRYSAADRDVLDLPLGGTWVHETVTVELSRQLIDTIAAWRRAYEIASAETNDGRADADWAEVEDLSTDIVHDLDSALDGATLAPSSR